MEMQASRALPASQQQAWDALNDPDMLKACIPGCDKLELTGEGKYDVGMALKIGPVSAKFKGKLQVSDLVPPESYQLAFDGQGGVAGFGKGQAQVRLEPLPDDALGQPCCELHYSVNATVGGKIAQLGQRLIDGAAKGMAEDFFKRFDEELRLLYPRAEPPENAEAPDAALVAPAKSGASQGGNIPVWVWGALVALLVAIAFYFN